MKKITLSLSVLLLSFAGFAQNFDATSNSTSVINLAPEAVLFDQSTTGTSGIISDYGFQQDIAVWSADDFTLATGGSITSITVNGFQNNANLLTILTGFDIYIYGDDGGMPNSNPDLTGTGLLELPNIDPAGGALTVVDGGGGSYTFTVDVTAANGSALELPAGTYWLVAAPRLDIPDVTDGPSRWNWYTTADGIGTGAEAHLIDPNDLFGGGYTNWTSFSDLGLTFFSTSFLIEGDLLSVGDKLANSVSIYPNPASSTLFVKTASNLDVSGVALYDVLGKNVGVSFDKANNSLNISNLANGVYVLRVNTNVGTITQKIVKQ